MISVVFPSQSNLENSLINNSMSAENEQSLRDLRDFAGTNGIDNVLDQHNLDAIGILTDNFIRPGIYCG